MKEEFLIEYIDTDRVAVLNYDRISKWIGELPIEVTSKDVAFYKYNIVGEIHSGEIRFLTKKHSIDTDEENDDYYDEDEDEEETPE